MRAGPRQWEVFVALALALALVPLGCGANRPAAATAAIVEPDPALCGNGIVDVGEICDQPLPLGGDCPEPWGMCWTCSSSCRSRTVVAPRGIDPIYCSQTSGTSQDNHLYDAHGRLLATRMSIAPGWQQWLYDDRGRVLRHWSDGDADERLDEDVRLTYGDHGDVESIELRGEDAWHPRAPWRASPPANPNLVAPYEPTSEWTRRGHDDQGRILSFEWEPRPGAVHHERFEYGTCCTAPTRIFGAHYDRRYTLDTACRAVAMTEDSDGDGVVNNVWQYTYDAVGREIRHLGIAATSGAIVGDVRTTRDTAGNIVHQWNDFDGDGRPESESRPTFDAAGRQTHWWDDRDGDGDPDFEIEARLDSAGRMVSKRVDADGDGRTDWHETKTWRTDHVDRTVSWDTGLSCDERLDLDERQVSSVCRDNDPPIHEETSLTYAPDTNLLLEQRVVIGGSVGVTTYDYGCLAGVFAAMPTIVARQPAPLAPDGCVPSPAL